MTGDISAAATVEDYAAFGDLVREYTAWLRARLAAEAWFMDAVLQHQSLDRELESLAAVYGLPHGMI